MRVLKKGGVLIFQVPDRPHAKRLDKLAYNARIRILSVHRTVPVGEMLKVSAVVWNASRLAGRGSYRQNRVIRYGWETTG